MREFSLEGLLVPLFILLLLLFNFLTQYFKKGRAPQNEVPQPQAPKAPFPEDETWGRLPRDETLVRLPGSAPVTIQNSDPVVAPGAFAPRAMPAVSVAHPTRALLAERRSVRDGIVLMTVLGPCRAMDSQATSPEAPRAPQ